MDDKKTKFEKATKNFDLNNRKVDISGIFGKLGIDCSKS
jgi:hypothetical protein